MDQPEAEDASACYQEQGGHEGQGGVLAEGSAFCADAPSVDDHPGSCSEELQERVAGVQVTEDEEDGTDDEEDAEVRW